jgi:hypothetical protein
MTGRVRIELSDGAIFSRETASLRGTVVAEVWLSDGDDGDRVRRTRKPQFSLIGESRGEVLQDLADWLTAHDDDQDLTGLAAEIIAQREELKRGERS